ncbi:PilZ domain-containing protein [Vibrio sp. TH_r3]|uniref:PilZ domain-containing protein n=1 Tax=Vibrio sp. TH_r3 TaxID=3082084 RepID=UPI002952BFF5|nr:PilZ domain-containing protein [Vibrio sp. TH_r3]MDV7103446.1 PilZ domain-containing protein [Vibrio sp. TH_r3]
MMQKALRIMSTKINDINKMKKYLEMGMRLSVTIKFGPKDEYSFQCNLIGLKDNQFLLLDLNQKTIEDLITRKTSNVSIIVRGITDTELAHIIAFKSQIISITSRPTWLMFIRLPYSFETKPIRSNKRFRLTSPVVVTHNEAEIKGAIVDLSVSGCGVYFSDELELEKESSVSISPELEHFPTKTTVCKVVNVKRFNGGILAGLKFDKDISMNDKLKLEILELGLSD